MRNIVTAIFFCAAAGAIAQPVWRCGNSYSSQPCEGGAVVQKAAPVNAAETAKARAVGKTDAELAAKLEQERLKREKDAPKAVIPPVAKPAESAKAAEKKPAKGKKKEPEHLTAVAPAPAGKKK